MYWLVGILPIIVQVLLIIHVIKTGRDRFWIYILIFIPVAGPLAYFFVEILPAVLSNPNTARLKTQIGDSINPGRRVADLELQLEVADTVENRKRLADEHLRNGNHEKAISLYQSCLEGIYEDDTYILSSLAEAYYRNRDLPNAKRILEKLETMGELSSKYTAWFVYAKVLEETNCFEDAEREYQALEGTFPRLEVLFHHGKFLQKLSRDAEAKSKFQEIMKISRQLPKHALKSQRRWLALARKELTG